MIDRRFPVLLLVLGTFLATTTSKADDLADRFRSPPDAARPWVYWMVMDGNFGPGGITEDLEAMKRVGIGGLIFMEVDVGIPRGPVAFMSPRWRQHFLHANQEAARLGLEITMPASPGWTGSGGPWVKPEQSMQKLVASELVLSGPARFTGQLPQPKSVAGYYRDVAVLAFPVPDTELRIENIEEKALYRRGHFSSEPGVAAMIREPVSYHEPSTKQVIAKDRIVDLSGRLDAGGQMVWDVPPGRWTVLRLGHTSTGATTRPAPEPGLGLECDKLDKSALDAHYRDFLGKLLSDLGPLTGKSLTALHIDSWEMGPQNWTARFPEEFRDRRGYALRPYLPVLTGRVVDSLEVSERFLWDLRQTVLELIAENHAGHLAELAHRSGLRLSIEPYDGTPCDDMTYGSRADVPMGEFWRDTFTTWFSCREAASIAHVQGKRVVPAEAFTSGDGERWQADPASLKALGDRAFCEGINRLVIHRYAHQPWLDRWPGMTMGPYGIHFERTQTWWELSPAWITYLSRCQYLLQRGLSVADLCYLAPEASPQVFQPSSKSADSLMTELAGYKLDGCTPEALLSRMSVKDGLLILPDGMSYRALVLPRVPSMTPRLLRKIKALVQEGATVIGARPVRSPSLSDLPNCDEQVRRLANELWGQSSSTTEIVERSVGKGRIFTGAGIQPSPGQNGGELYPDEHVMRQILDRIGVTPDLEADRNLRFAHRRDGGGDIYFVANPDPTTARAICRFRLTGKQPELWDPVTGQTRPAEAFRQEKGQTIIPLELPPSASLFVLFRQPADTLRSEGTNFPEHSGIKKLNGPWTVRFDPRWGGPESAAFPILVDWTKRPEAGIKYYSGTAIYTTTLTLASPAPGSGQRLFLDLGRVKSLAQVKVNGTDLGILWTPPFRLELTRAIRPGENQLEVRVVNLWPNRMIGDQFLPPEKRFTSSTWNPFQKDSPLLESGLLGPVEVLAVEPKMRFPQ